MISANRVRAHAALRRGRLRWWLVYGPVRCGTTLMADLVAGHARWEISDWGLHAALAGPLGHDRAGFDRTRPRRALLAEVMAVSARNRRAPIDVVYKQANVRADEVAAVEDVLGPAERRIFCLRDPAGFMQSAVRKFPTTELENLRESNYIGTIDEHERVGGDVFLYHPDVTGDEYARFLHPLAIDATARASVRYTGSSAEELTTPAMWEAFERLAARAVNRR
jgi:hypothetical protein